MGVKRFAAAVVSLGFALATGAGCDEFGLFSSRADATEDMRTLGVVSFHAASTLDPQGVLGGAAGAAERFTVEARFVQFDAPFEAEVREMLGLAELDVLPPVDECTYAALVATPAATLDPDVPAAPGGVELLDVGRILVRGAGTEQSLAVRTFPDLLDVMSGVTYGGGSALPYGPGRRYEVRGEADRTPWVAVYAPPGWDDLRVDGMSVRDGLVGAFDPEPRVELRWIPWTDRGSDVMVTLFWSGASGAPEGIICHPADDGTFDLPARALALLPAAPDLADLTLRVDRIVRVSFPLDRLDETEAVFRVSLTTPVR
jgi:hypothetical protein